MTLDLLPHTGLTFDSTSLMRDDLSLFLAIKRGLGEIPTVRGEDQVVPGRAGRIARARVADQMSIELEGWVGGISDDDPVVITEPEAYITLVRELVALFDPTQVPKALACTLADGSTASILVRVSPPLLWDEKIAGRHAKLNVALVSVVPTWTITPAP